MGRAAVFILLLALVAGPPPRVAGSSLGVWRGSDPSVIEEEDTPPSAEEMEAQDEAREKVAEESNQLAATEEDLVRVLESVGSIENAVGTVAAAARSSASTAREAAANLPPSTSDLRQQLEDLREELTRTTTDMNARLDRTRLLVEQRSSESEAVTAKVADTEKQILQVGAEATAKVEDIEKRTETMVTAMGETERKQAKAVEKLQECQGLHDDARAKVGELAQQIAASGQRMEALKESQSDLRHNLEQVEGRLKAIKEGEATVERMKEETGRLREDATKLGEALDGVKAQLAEQTKRAGAEIEEQEATVDETQKAQIAEEEQATKSAMASEGEVTDEIGNGVAGGSGSGATQVANESGDEVVDGNAGQGGMGRRLLAVAEQRSSRAQARARAAAAVAETPEELRGMLARVARNIANGGAKLDGVPVQSAADAFTRADKNGDGTLSLEEVTHALDELQPLMPTQVLARLIVGADTEKRVSQEEWVRALQDDGSASTSPVTTPPTTT
eukprot:CAMPEP_0196769274 /NCGR_PEP_ID=MMETSP1104-20130614/433_1 /TAXON_ID=33652 /ORGANISM="Cafeteria sp., Strain Caron Lab Isolate" /LENGTH=505 /DNA_ID=CAMNT_0042139359 /DNA_START=1 /DNA_END=1514 /DNA_ORIENTATION=+